jgi:hypothetical protein
MTIDKEEQEERRATLENDLRVARERNAATYHQFATDEADTPRGRFTAIEKPTVIGASPVEYPPQPENSPWRADPVPPEPLIDATDCGATFGTALGEPHELTASPLEPSPLPDAQGISGDPTVAPSTNLPVDVERVGSPVLSDEGETEK